AAPGTSDYGALSLILQLQYRVEFLRSVPATVFLPAPDVDSAFVRIAPRRADELPPYDPERFFRLVRQGFSQRRKQLRNLLRTEISRWDEAATALGFDPRARAEELGLEQWIALSNIAGLPPENATPGNDSELFQVVDENDEATGAAPRGEVHGNNLRHRAVHVFIFNRHGELFLQKRSRWKDRHPLLWDSSAAGHVDAGENYDETAVRELQEELGVTGTLTRVGKLGCSKRTGWEFIWLYRGEHEGPFQLAAAEIEYGEFFPIDIIDRWTKARPQEFAPGFLECWSVFRKA
ncbi:MAG TPA: NUDIX domain-containing protein, partial [Chthoniobacterales bacterium]|nr:NUDIX domain-containing protein [Chthoniobacterales bacterium]